MEEVSIWTELWNLYPVIWWVFMISAILGSTGAWIGILANVIDWIFKPKFLFFHIVANILWSLSLPVTLFTFLLIMIDAYIYDFIRPF